MMLNRNSGWKIPAMLVLLSLVLTRCRAFQPEAVVVNKAPETYIIGAPAEDGGGYFHFHVYWYGSDEEGRVERFVWAVTDTTVQDDRTSDDEEDIRIVLKEIFVREGFDVGVASDGTEGLNLIRETGADLVITDIIMPGSDGVETAYDIRMEFPHTKIIVMSGGGNTAPLDYEPTAISTNAYLASAEALGADLTMTKPFDRKELIKVVRELTGQ